MFSTSFLDIPPLSNAQGTVVLPGSKSISNRVLLLAALSEGTTRVHDLLDSDDTRVMLDALRALGCGVRMQTRWIEIDGLGARLPQALSQAPEPLKLFLGNAGTAMRPLTAALALLGGHFELSGVPRMHERPIGDLVEALQQLGCQIEYLGTPGYPPLRLHPAKAQGARHIQVRGNISSQFLTALLMALPLLQQEVVIEVVGELISRPYVEITLHLLRQFGIHITREGWSRFVVPAHASYRTPQDIYVEADASSASYFIALGALAQPIGPGGCVRIEGVGLDSMQGDIRLVEVVQAMGAHIEGGANWLEVSRQQWPLKAVDLDCNHIPDAAMTLVVMALFADGPSTLRNIGSWRVKETDRLSAMTKECRKLGAVVEEGSDWIRITPPNLEQWRSASIHTYDDHRIAMCFSLVALNPAKVGVRIEDPQCVAKTFPDYFETLLSLVYTAPEHIPVICIDGPSASGKGTVAAAVAQALGYHFLDSGAVYRVAALAAQRAGMVMDIDNEVHLADLAQDLPIRFKKDSIFLGEEDVSAAIRSESVGLDASRIAAYPKVRQALTRVQLAFRQLPGLVADGRDMGTVVFPQAPLKVFLTASAACRAQRRYNQLISQGSVAKLEELRADLEARDARDAQRPVAPLQAAKDAFLLDNSNLDAEQTVQQVLLWWQSQHPFQASRSFKEPVF